MNFVGWPFPVVVDGDFESGFPVTVTVDLAVPLTDQSCGLQRYAVESFVGLAAVGGLGGDRVAPSRSTATLDGLDLGRPGEAQAVWRLGRVAIDPRALVVLVNSLAFLNDSITRIVIQAPGEGLPLSIGVDDLPPPWPQVPFALDDDRSGPSVELQIEFLSPVPSQDVEAVHEALQSWLDCGSIHGYRDWSVDASNSFLAPTDDPAFQFDGDRVSAVLEDSGVHEGCYDILVNVLITLNERSPIAVAALL